MKKNLIKAFETDASQILGTAVDVIIPKNLMELKGAVANNSHLVIRGGGTGLAGGAVPQKGDVVLDTSRLTKIEKLDTERGTVEVEAGVILDDLQAYLRRYDLEFPVNPSSHAVATIGGMIATDAVGSRAIKYGKTSAHVRWIEIVDCYGNIQRKGVTELSDYAGMEGITGVIVRACLNLSPIVLRTASLIAADDISKVISIVESLKRDQTVSMIEFIDKKISKMLEMEEKYHLIIEYEGNAGLLQGKEYDELFAMRDKIYPILAKEGYVHIEDPKVRVDKFDKVMPWLEARGIPVFGHLSVGIFHPCFDEDQKKYVSDLMNAVLKISGRVSGEHGIGLLKKEFVEANDKKIIVNIKKRTDPLSKFNQGKVI